MITLLNRTTKNIAVIFASLWLLTVDVCSTCCLHHSFIPHDAVDGRNPAPVDR